MGGWGAVVVTVGDLGSGSGGGVAEDCYVTICGGKAVCYWKLYYV